QKSAGEGRNGIRQVRRDANDKLKKLLKEHKISEDDERRALEDVQKATDAHIAPIDDGQHKKDTDLLGKKCRISHISNAAFPAVRPTTTPASNSTSAPPAACRCWR